MPAVLQSVLIFLLMLGVVSTWAAYLVCRFSPREVRVSHRMLMQPA
jgi:hypothetical protein